VFIERGWLRWCRRARARYRAPTSLGGSTGRREWGGSGGATEEEVCWMGKCMKRTNRLRGGRGADTGGRSARSWWRSRRSARHICDAVDRTDRDDTNPTPIRQTARAARFGLSLYHVPDVTKIESGNKLAERRNKLEEKINKLSEISEYPRIVYRLRSTIAAGLGRDLR
jgi:hypothetical protein